LKDIRSKLPGVIEWGRNGAFVGKDDQTICIDFVVAGKAPLAELLANFPQFYLAWHDSYFTRTEDGSGPKLCGRFGEVWTSDFQPYWFVDDGTGDRYYSDNGVDGNVVAATTASLVWSKIGHEFLVDGMFFTAGESDTEYSYGRPVHGTTTTYEQVNAAIEDAIQNNTNYVPREG
jgi:hypothetical protein